jgi:hypothetical protein
VSAFGHAGGIWLFQEAAGSEAVAEKKPQPNFRTAEALHRLGAGLGLRGETVRERVYQYLRKDPSRGGLR